MTASEPTRTDQEWRAFYEAEAIRLLRENVELKARLLLLLAPSIPALSVYIPAYLG